MDDLNKLNKKINDNQWNKFAEPIDSLKKQEDPKSETNHNLETGAMKQTAPKTWKKTVSSKSARKLGMPNKARVLYGLPKKDYSDNEQEPFTDTSEYFERFTDKSQKRDWLDGAPEGWSGRSPNFYDFSDNIPEFLDSYLKLQEDDFGEWDWEIKNEAIPTELLKESLRRNKKTLSEGEYNYYLNNLDHYLSDMVQEAIEDWSDAIED